MRKLTAPDIVYQHDGRRNRPGKMVICPDCQGSRWVSLDNLKRMQTLRCEACSLASGVKPKTGWYKPCATCGQPIWVTPATAARKKFCSTRCVKRPDANRGRVYHRRAHPPKPRRARAKGICRTCGDEFTKHNAAQVFCSHRCAANRPDAEHRPGYKRGRFAGRRNPYLYGGQWPSIRKATIQRDGHRCQHEGCTMTRLLEVHHIRTFDPAMFPALQNAPENLITLCRKHHRQAHGH